MAKTKGLLIVYSGPSGVGKGTIREEFFRKPELNLKYSISMTTRAPRPGEVDGVDYFFVSESRFKDAINNDEFLEYATFVNHSYGTPKEYVESLRNQGFNVVLEIEVNGAKQIMEKCTDSISIFLVPPSIEVLEQRIRNRGTEDEEIIKQRLTRARQEIAEKDLYDYVVVNDDKQTAVEEVVKIIKKCIKDNEALQL